MKKILVIGSNGRVGSLLVRNLAKLGHQVFAGARDDKQGFNDSNIEFVHLDLLDDVDSLQEVMQGIDTVYFVSGSRGKDLLKIDLHGAIKTMQAATEANVDRYIMLSSIFSLEPKRWNESFLKDLTDYNIAKHYADRYLIEQRGLKYTILQPGALKEEEGSGKITVNVDTPGSNSIDNVVGALIGVLNNDNTIGKVISMHDGDKAIDEALSER